MRSGSVGSVLPATKTTPRPPGSTLAGYQFSLYSIHYNADPERKSAYYNADPSPRQASGTGFRR